MNLKWQNKCSSYENNQFAITKCRVFWNLLEVKKKRRHQNQPPHHLVPVSKLNVKRSNRMHSVFSLRNGVFYIFYRRKFFKKNQATSASAHHSVPRHWVRVRRMVGTFKKTHFLMLSYAFILKQLFFTSSCLFKIPALIDSSLVSFQKQFRDQLTECFHM